MPSNCSHCKQLYQLEPSFFYGAMYVNYAITVAIAVAVAITMYVLGNGRWELHEYILGIIIAMILLAPITFRMGRAIWINLFIKYDPNADGAQKEDASSSI